MEMKIPSFFSLKKKNQMYYTSEFVDRDSRAYKSLRLNFDNTFNEPSDCSPWENEEFFHFKKRKYPSSKGYYKV